MAGHQPQRANGRGWVMSNNAKKWNSRLANCAEDSKAHGTVNLGQGAELGSAAWRA